MKDGKYEDGDLIHTTVADADDQTFRDLVRYTTTLSETFDDEEPHSYLGWHEVVAIAGFVPDDRDVGMHERLIEKDPEWIGFFGGTNVRPDLRGKGIQPVSIRYRVGCIQYFVDTSYRRAANVYALSTNAASERNLIQHGSFEHLGTWYINHSRKNESVIRRRFVPAVSPG